MRVGLRHKIEQLPFSPGVYIFRDRTGKPIYVGKAKALRSRVRSYFQPAAQHPPRTARMVSEVRDLDCILVPTETEALILEANLIKSERPRYNVILRDDKQFPYLKLSVRDLYPRGALVRQPRLDGQLYVGPFLPASAARASLKLIQRQFRVATCKEVFDGKRRPCLYYHLDQCLAPCAGKTTPQEYRAAVDDVRLFLEGRDRELEQSLDRRMREASAEQRYELAARHRDTLRAVRGLSRRQRMASVGLEEQDFWAHHVREAEVALQVFQMRAGKIQGRRAFALQDVEFSAERLYATVLAQYYAETDPPREIYLAELPADRTLLEDWLSERAGRRVRLRLPRRGPKRRLLELVRANAEAAFESRFGAAHVRGVEGLDELARVLELDEPPYRIECFDVSNVQGTDNVAGLVVWEGGKPRRAEYRSFHIRDVQGPDDYAAIAEAVTRRYRRLLAEERRLPDLILIDGGAGQLGAAVGALAREGLSMLAVAAIAKREEELYLQARARPLRLSRHSAALRLVQRIRDEAHRFALTRHRRRRAARTLRTELTDVPGIGAASARKLLRLFGSVEGVRRATPEELRSAVGPRRAQALLARYGKETTG